MSEQGGERKVVYVTIDRLLLDKDNPRLFSGEKPSSQEQIVKILWEQMAIDELIASIAANGFWEEEPLFVIPETKGGNPQDSNTNLIVVEGNRRLAAVRLLVDIELQNKLKIKTIPKLTKAHRQSLLSLPVSMYETRKQLWAFLAFRHINSPQPWDAYSKASYVIQIHEEFGIPVQEITDRIGDRHSTVVRFVRGYRVLEQAEKTGMFSAEDRMTTRFYFSHLYAATSYSEFQAFLGILDKKPERRNPVPKDKLENLRELLIWLYGSRQKKKESIISSQNPDLNILREVISKPVSLDALRSGIPLHRSFEIGIGDERRFRDGITKALEGLRETKQSVTLGYKGEKYLYDSLSEGITLIESIRTEMEEIQEKSRKSKKK